MATKKADATKKKAPAKKSTKTSAATKTTVKTVPATAKKQTLGQHLEGAMLSKSLWRALGAEFVGTFLLAGVIIAGQGQPIFALFGLVGIVLLVGVVSGAHVNPAITVAAWATRRIGWLRAVAYILVQFLGAAAAFFALSAFVGGAAQPTAEQQLYGQSAASLFAATDLAGVAGKEWYVFFAEITGAAILGLGMAAALRALQARDTIAAAFSAGSGLFLGLLFGVVATGYVAASSILNPAVALSLQAFTASSWTYIVYALAPVIGAVIGFLIFDLLRGKQA